MPARPEPKRSATPLSPGKVVAFWAIMLLLPVVFFLLLEGGLRLGGYGASFPLFIEIEEHPHYLVQSRDAGRRYFRHSAEAPTALHDVFLTDKPEHELRLFVQGGSTAAGFPFYHGAAFSRMLKWRLQESMTGRPVEVVNTAMAAVNSFTLLDLSNEIIEQQPDAVLIYAGHNEYYGAFGVGSTETFGTSRTLVNSYLRLRNVRTVQLVGAGLSRMASMGVQKGEPTGGTLMARMVARQSIPLGSRDYYRGLRQFEGNLRDLLATYRRAGVPVFIGTLVFNERDHEPFTTVFGDATDVEVYMARLEEGQRALAAGRTDDALSIFRELTQTDDQAASGHFALGRALEAVGDTAAALLAYRDASDRDALRFRAPSAFNEIIRRVAAEQGAVVVDVEARFRQDAPGGVIGREHMLEHLHPTVEGYFLMSDAFYAALVSSPILIDERVEQIPTALARTRVRVTPADSLAGMIRVKRLTSGWPFAPAGSISPSAESLIPAGLPESRTALELYYGRNTWLEATAELANDLERDGRVAEAIRTREAMIQSYPMLPQPYLGLAGLLTRQRQLDLAVRHYEEAIRRGERTGLAHGLLGAIVLERAMQAGGRGEIDRARDELTRAISLLEQSRRFNPRNAQTHFNLSGAYAQAGRYDAARQSADRVLELQPTHAGAHALLASLPGD